MAKAFSLGVPAHEDMVQFNDDGSVEVALKNYDTGWVACSDWTNQHLGTTLGNDVAHDLGEPLRNLMVKVFISTDGTDANSWEIKDTGLDQNASKQMGLVILQVDADNITVQTGLHGMHNILDDGTIHYLDAESWYYRVVVYRMRTD